jgi:hypothetical protein
LRDIKRLLDLIQSCEGASSPSYSERVQGGERTPTALRRLELQDVLDRHSVILVDVVKLFVSQRDKKRVAYVCAIMDGAITPKDWKTRRIKDSDLEALRIWLSREMDKIQARHGVV